MVNKNRNLIAEKARGREEEDPEDKQFPWFPKPVNEPSDDASGINDTPALINFMESAEGSVRDSVEGVLASVAKEELATQKDDSIVFFTAKASCGVVPQVRKDAILVRQKPLRVQCSLWMFLTMMGSTWQIKTRTPIQWKKASAVSSAVSKNLTLTRQQIS